MSEVPGRTSSALAITERKGNNQRSGGCVGVFFQLFDWNRRFSKKKFFPKKLLPPARTKVSKKFNADEKLPVGKHLLIADDENSGGFPGRNNSKMKNGDKKVGLGQKKQEMKSPGLVARLMGLEAMPDAGTNSDDGLIVSPEKKRPQKIQRTGMSERKPVTRFGAEALQIKNVLARARKQHHHPKLVSPVKSPRIGRCGSRLMEAAARILEPGVQASSRARCSLTYSTEMSEGRNDEVMADGVVGMDLDGYLRSDCVGQQMNAQDSCRGCGSFMEQDDVRCIGEERMTRFGSPANDFREVFYSGSEVSRPRPTIYLENETDVVLLRTRRQHEYNQPEFASVQRVEDKRPVQNEMVRNINMVHQPQIHAQIPGNRMFTSQKDKSASVTVKDRAPRRSQMLVGDRVPPRSRLASTNGRRFSPPVNTALENKDFIALNRNINRTQLGAPRSDNRVESERRFCTGKANPLTTQRNPVRKRRTLNVNKPVDNAGSTSSQRSARGDVTARNVPRTNCKSVNRTYVKSRSVSDVVSKDTDVVSFTFNSPVKSNIGACSPNEMGVKRSNDFDSVIEENLQLKMIMEENAMRNTSQSFLLVNGDALGALLEQKLKELTQQVENEAAAGFVPSAKTTASILQELISALTTERPTAYENEGQGPATYESPSEVFKAKPRISGGFSQDADHFSPGCVLDASFSNESCISSSIEDSSGHMMQSDYMDLSYNTIQAARPDADLSDSASSVNKARRCNLMVVTELRKHIATVLQNVDLVHSRLTGTKLNFAEEVLLNAELLFGNVGLRNSFRFVDFLLGSFLDELEYLVIAAWKNTVILGLEVRKEENPVRRFLFDCLLECLDVKYRRCNNIGYGAWCRVPKNMNADVMIKVFDEEMRKWISLSGKALDEIIEKEMSTSLGKWTDFNIEAYEIGAQINDDIVQTLVDEVVMDLYGSGLRLC